MKKFIIIGIIVVVVVVFIFLALQGSGKKEQANNSIRAEMGSIIDKALAIGQIEPKDQISVKSKISGIVRPQDVGTNNTILSTQIGDARITYSGKGVLAESNEMGWLARFFNHPIWPF